MTDEEDDERLNALLIAQTLGNADRREALCRGAKLCPECGTQQVQLTNYFVRPAQWKCRHCKHRFTHEPDQEDAE